MLESMTWVINASPLILLGKIDQLALLDALATKFIIPASVIDEITSGMYEDPSVQLIMKWAGHQIKPDVDVPSSILGWDLGRGETQVLAYAYLNQFGAVLDDAAARAAAKAHQIPMIGSLGVILRARQKKLIPAVRPLIEQLLAHGSYLSDDLVQQALSKVGE